MEIFLIPHFHYDPTWIKTQYDYTEREKNSAFKLIKEYLEISIKDKDFIFVLEQIPYLKPYWDNYPEDRNLIKKLIKEKRLEITGGMYNEAQTTFISSENIIRNIAYGKLYNRYILGFESVTSWVLDVFGHEINFPQFLKKAGIKFCTFARGPYKRGWGIPPDEIIFKTEFYWIAPDGSKILTHLMEPGHYGYGYGKLRKEEYEFGKIKNKMQELYSYAGKFSLVPILLFPLGGDMAQPIPWLGDFVRDYSKEKEEKVKFYLAIPQKYFSKIKEKEKEVFIPPISMDFDPVNNGCDVSYIDLKIANRKIENFLTSAEKFSTISYLLGGKYPYLEVDKAWRQLLFNSHHDALTGSCSDQAYVDLVGSYREAYELAKNSLEVSLEHIVNLVKIKNNKGTPYIIFNILNWEKTDVIEIENLENKGIEIYDEEGNSISCRNVDGKIIFIAENIPSLGYKTYFIKNSKNKKFSFKKVDDLFIENEYYKITVDNQGGIVSIIDKENSKEIIKKGCIGNELVAHKEYPDHPHWKEGPWNLSFTGEKIYSSLFPAEVKVEKGEILQRIVVSEDFFKCKRKSEIRVYKKIKRIDFITDVIDYTGENICYKVHFPLNLKDVVPVYEVANSVITRAFCSGDKDTKIEPSNQDNACYNFIDLSGSLKIEFVNEKNQLQNSLPLGVGEIVYGDNPPEDEIFQLVSSLIQKGVSTVCTKDKFRRYGDIKWDSNVCNFRIVIGTPQENSFTKLILEKLDKKEVKTDILFLENIKLNLPVDVPIFLILNNQKKIIKKIVSSIKKYSKIILDNKFYIGRKKIVEDYGVALINQGTVSGCVYGDNTLTMSLFRSSTGSPSGVWIDEPKRTLPDKCSFETMHWNHKFFYSLYPHRGDWREAKVYKVGYEVNNPLVVKEGKKKNKGKFPSSYSFLKLQPSNLILSTLKLKGYPTITNKYSDLITARIYEAEGKNTKINFSFFKKILNIKESDILEENLFKTNLNFQPVETKTLILKTKIDKNKLCKDSRFKGKFYNKFWRYNSGCAPLGFQPVSLNFIEEGSKIKIASCGCKHIKGEVNLELPKGWKLRNKDLKYNLKKDEYKIFPFKIEPHKFSPDKVYKIKAMTKDEFGFEYFDVLWIGLDKKIEKPLQYKLQERIRIKKGEEKEIYLNLKNKISCKIEGKAVLVSPYETWEWISPYAIDFKLPPDKDIKLKYFISPPSCIEAGKYWGIFKITYEGLLDYTEVFSMEII